MDNNYVKSVNLLLVEDDNDFACALVSRLEKRGIIVTGASSAEEALKIFDEKNFDAIISDIKLPGTDGMQFLTKVREKNKETPVILLIELKLP